MQTASVLNVHARINLVSALLGVMNHSKMNTKPVARQLSRSTHAQSHSARAVFVALGTVFCIAGLIYSVFGLGDAFRFPDEFEYHNLASNLAAMIGYSLDGMTPSAMRPPGYAFLMAPIHVVTDSIHVVRLLQFALLVWAAHLLASQLIRPDTLSRWGGSVALLACVAAYPVLIYTAGTLFPQTCILFTLTLAVVLLQSKSNSLLLAAVIGLLSGLTALISPTALTIVPVALAFALLSQHWSLSRVFIMAAAIVLLLGGWIARNQVVMGRPIVFSTNLTWNMDIASSVSEPNEAGSKDSELPEIPYLTEPESLSQSTISHAGATEQSVPQPPAANLLDKGIARLAQLFDDPSGYLRNLGAFFAYDNDMQTASEDTSVRELVMFFTYYLLLSGVLARLILSRYRPLSRAEWLVLGLYFSTAFLHALVFTRIRYRLPFDFLLFLPALNAALLMYERYRLSVMNRRMVQ